MEKKDEIIQLIKRHINIERDHVLRLNEIRKKVDNAAAKLLLLEMQLDSKKHEDILTAILTTIEGVPSSKTLWQYRLEGYIDPILARKEVENHIQMETDVLAHVEEEIKKTKDESIKMLLQHIAEDEKKHHKILEEIAKNTYKITK